MSGPSISRKKKGVSRTSEFRRLFLSAREERDKLRQQIEAAENKCRAYKEIAEHAYLMLGLPDGRNAFESELARITAGLPWNRSAAQFKLVGDWRNQLALSPEQLHARYGEGAKP